MENLFNLSAVAPAMATDDYVGFTFFCRMYGNDGSISVFLPLDELF